MACLFNISAEEPEKFLRLVDENEAVSRGDTQIPEFFPKGTETGQIIRKPVRIVMENFSKGVFFISKRPEQ